MRMHIAILSICVVLGGCAGTTVKLKWDEWHPIRALISGDDESRQKQYRHSVLEAWHGGNEINYFQSLELLEAHRHRHAQPEFAKPQL